MIRKELDHPKTADQVAHEVFNFMGGGKAEPWEVILDVDDTFLKSNSHDHPELLPGAPDLFEQLWFLEKVYGFLSGLMTARGLSAVKLARDFGLRINGFSVVEEGLMGITPDGEERVFTYQEVPQCLANFRQKLEKKLGKHFKKDWAEVADTKRKKRRICVGNKQWQGTCRMSLWYRTTGDEEKDRNRIEPLILPVLENEALKLGLTKDDFTLTYHISGKVGYVGIRGKVRFGDVANKGTAFAALANEANAIGKNFPRCIYLADGENDFEGARKVHEEGGIVFGIRSPNEVSPSARPEVQRFLEEVDYVFDSVGKVARVFEILIALLGVPDKSV